MGHLQKFNIQNYDWVISHCDRTLTGEHESHSVDKSLSHLNYQNATKLWAGQNGLVKPKKVVDDLISKYGLRKNGVCLASWVFQPTDEVKKEDYDKFFGYVSRFMYARYGNNFLCSEIHLDEPNAKPHSHNLIVPIVDGKFKAKQIFTKKELLTIHKDLSKYLTENLGYPVNMLTGTTIKDAKGKAIKVSKYNALKQENEILQSKIDAISTFEKERKQVLRDTDKNSYNALLSAEKKVLASKPSIAKRVIAWLNNIFHRNDKPLQKNKNEGIQK